MVHVRLTRTQSRWLRQLMAKSGQNQSTVIRLALAVLAEQEGIKKPPKRVTPGSMDYEAFLKVKDGILSLAEEIRRAYDAGKNVP